MPSDGARRFGGGARGALEKVDDDAVIDSEDGVEHSVDDIVDANDTDDADDIDDIDDREGEGKQVVNVRGNVAATLLDSDHCSVKFPHPPESSTLAAAALPPPTKGSAPSRGVL